MKYLLDTHIFIWSMENSKKLSPKVKLLLKDSTNEVFISMATVWEVIIKQSKGKLNIPRDVENGISQAGFRLLSIDIVHVLGIKRLPVYQNHKDPFDKMLISQAKVEKLKLITADPKIWKYNISMIKA